LSKSGKDINPDKTIVFIDAHQKVLLKTAAVLHIATLLDGAWPLLFTFIIVPPFIRDGIYDFIAKRRRRFFSKYQNCMLLTDDLKSRFI